MVRKFRTRPRQFARSVIVDARRNRVACYFAHLCGRAALSRAVHGINKTERTLEFAINGIIMTLLNEMTSYRTEE